MTRTLQLPLILTGALGLSLFIGCGDKDDTGDVADEAEICDDGIDNDGDGDEDCADSDCDGVDPCGDEADNCDDGVDNDGDGDTDCADSDCEEDEECVSFFVPDFILMSASTGLKEGAQYDVTTGGSSLGHYFEVTLIDSEAWSGAEDTRNYCTVLWDTTGADVSADCADCWGGAAWLVDTSMLLGTDGECEDLDPDDWSDDVAAYLSGAGFGYGYGPLSTEFKATLQESYKADWAEYGDYFLSNYIMSELTGSSDWVELNWAFAYEYDETGALVDGGASIIDMSGAAGFAPDGYYQGRYYYGYPL